MRRAQVPHRHTPDVCVLAWFLDFVSRTCPFFSLCALARVHFFTRPREFTRCPKHRFAGAAGRTRKPAFFRYIDRKKNGGAAAVCRAAGAAHHGAKCRRRRPSRGGAVRALFEPVILH